MRQPLGLGAAYPGARQLSRNLDESDPAVGHRCEEGNAGYSCTAALIENVQREVGLAVFDPTTLELHLVQYIEAHRSYSTTSMLLATHGVESVVLVECADKHKAFAAASVSMVSAGMSRVSYLPRRSYDDTAGLESVMACCNEESQASLSHAQASLARGDEVT